MNLIIYTCWYQYFQWYSSSRTIPLTCSVITLPIFFNDVKVIHYDYTNVLQYILGLIIGKTPLVYFFLPISHIKIASAYSLANNWCSKTYRIIQLFRSEQRFICFEINLFHNYILLISVSKEKGELCGGFSLKMFNPWLCIYADLSLPLVTLRVLRVRVYNVK